MIKRIAIELLEAACLMGLSGFIVWGIFFAAG